MYKTSVFIFRRDLRINDNTALISAINNSKSVIPLFICTPAQLSNENKYKSSNAVQFMIESLYDLNTQIRNAKNKSKLWIMYGNEIDVLGEIISYINVEAIYINEDYSPYSIARDNNIKKFCKKNEINYHCMTDVLLIDETMETKAQNGNYNKVFTQFYKNSIKK